MPSTGMLIVDTSWSASLGSLLPQLPVTLTQWLCLTLTFLFFEGSLIPGVCLSVYVCLMNLNGHFLGGDTSPLLPGAAPTTPQVETDQG